MHITEEITMQTIMVTDNILALEAAAIVKGAQEWLTSVPAYEPTPAEKLKAELIMTLRELTTEERDLLFFHGAAEVQIHISLEQKKVIDAALAETEARKKNEKRPEMLKALDAAYWRTMRTRKRLLREIDGLFTEKRDLAGKLRTVRSLRTGIKGIINNPLTLAAAVASMESETIN
jgi:hypothetical protein